jgi:hypothetical protein
MRKLFTNCISLDTRTEENEPVGIHRLIFQRITGMMDTDYCT